MGNKILAGLAVSLGLSVAAMAAVPAVPGTLNYVEGQVSVNGKSVTASAVGSTELGSGAVLQTRNGKAEVLLTPGVLLRVGNNSQIRMDSAALMDTRIDLNRGAAMVEAGDLHKQNHIQISNGAFNTTLEKEGLYRFDADRNVVAVFDGKAEVRTGDQSVELKKGRELIAGASKPQKFDVSEAKKGDELYQWSELRSSYVAKASSDAASRIVVGGWYGPGWYWDPWWHSYGWVPGTSWFYSPFGYGYGGIYAPIYVYPRYRLNPIRPGLGGGFHRPIGGFHRGGPVGGRAHR